MIPKITSGGGSFKGAFRYYMHDKGADTRGRIAWAQCENMFTSDPDKAWKVMAFTAQEQARLKEASGQSRAGRKLEKPVFAFSLAWHPEQSPDAAHMLATAREAVAVLGLTEHEAVIVAHRDEPQKHVHVIVNRVHPLTGMAGDVRNSKRKLSDFALAYERTTGKIYCKQREENEQRRSQGEPARYRDTHIAEAWETTTTGPAFIAALEAKGYRLAQGRKRLVIIDPHGKAHNPTRHLTGVKAEHIRARLAGVDLSRLPDADAPAPQDREPDHAEKRKREVQERLEAFDQIAVARRDSLREGQRQAFALQEVQNTRGLVHARKHLATYYKLEERRDALKALKQKIMQAPWWKRLFRLTKKDRKVFAEQARIYHKAVRHYRQKVEDTRQKGQQTLEALQTTHEREQVRLEAALQRQRSLLQDLTIHGHQGEQDLTIVFSAASKHEKIKEKSGERRMRTDKAAYSPAHEDEHHHNRRDGGRGL